MILADFVVMAATAVIAVATVVNVLITRSTLGRHEEAVGQATVSTRLQAVGLVLGIVFPYVRQKQRIATVRSAFALATEGVSEATEFFDELLEVVSGALGGEVPTEEEQK